MSAPKLATTTFEAGADDKLAVVDVYEESGGGVVNSFQETHDDSIDVLAGLDGAGADATGGLQDALGDVQNLNPADAIGEALGGVNNDLSDLLGDMPDIGTLGGGLEELANGDLDILSSISDLSGPLSDSISQIGQGFDDISVIENGVVVGSIASGFDLKSIKSINDVVTNLSDGNYAGIINHTGGLSNLVSNVCNIGSRMGIPGVFNNISKGINDVTVMTKALTNMVPNIIQTANINLLNDIARSPLAKVVGKIAPNIVSSTIANIAKPINMVNSEIGKFYSKARDTFSAIDSNWNKATIGVTSVLNATAIGQNEFMKQAMMANICARPLDLVVAENGVVNVNDTYYDEPGTGMLEMGYSSDMNPSDGDTTDTDPVSNYNRNTESRFIDSFIAGATAFENERVSESLSADFPEVFAGGSDII